MEYQDDVARGLDPAPARVERCGITRLDWASEPHGPRCILPKHDDAKHVWEYQERRTNIPPDFRPTYNLDLVTRKLRPGVTVCIAAHPARLRNGMLERALKSVLAQTLQPEAVAIVNDMERRGAGWTRRTLLEDVHTEWIAWLDSDDEWLPEHLEKLVRTATETDSVFVNSWFHGNDPLGHFGLPFDPCRPHHTTMNVLVRTDIAKRVGFYDSQPPPFSNEDWGFITGVAKICCEEGLKMTHLPERTWHYIQQGQNTSGQPTQGDAR